MCEGKINANEKIEKMLSLRLEDLSKKSFIRDWKAVVNIRNKEQARDAKIDCVLNDLRDDGSFVEASYQMLDLSLHSVRIEFQLSAHVHKRKPLYYCFFRNI